MGFYYLSTIHSTHSPLTSLSNPRWNSIRFEFTFLSLRKDSQFWKNSLVKSGSWTEKWRRWLIVFWLSLSGCFHSYSVCILICKRFVNFNRSGVSLLLETILVDIEGFSPMIEHRIPVRMKFQLKWMKFQSKWSFSWNEWRLCFCDRTTFRRSRSHSTS